MRTVTSAATLFLVVLALAAPAAGLVLWDTTHGIYEDFHPDGQYSYLADRLADLGLPVMTTNQGVDNIDLSPYEVLVLSVSTAWASAYTVGEVAAIAAFVADGGGLLVMADNMYTPAAWHLDPVTQHFGTTILQMTPEPYDTWITDFADHEILAGVDELFFGCVGILIGEDPSAEVAWTDAGDAMITTCGAHEVVVLSDCSFCINGEIIYADNELFILNVFAWLADGPVRTADTTWSQVRGLFR